MKCQRCSKPATVHLTDIVKGKKRVTHLCQACAEQQQLLSDQELNLTKILHTVIGPHLGAPSDALGRLVCPECGIKYMEFKATGRLGCPRDYAVFRGALEPLLLRIHRATRHVGKTPRRPGPGAARLAEIVRLRQQLRQAVEAEAYEDAVRLRDLIRQKEAGDEPRQSDSDHG